MKNLIIALVCWISFSGCTNVRRSTNELEKRSHLNMSKTSKSAISPKKYQVIEKAYLGGRFIKTGDWFHGSWVSLIVEDKEYIFDDPILKKLNKNR